ncbi:hypothetical protein B0T26DRAFT_745285 [Lasiosphaeria miniovina]|uniref:Uncharacterized protein n=1 Tax=Lasiosphaeria miniovina TaxID=1954250 RepID=A0AA40EFC9_9PEZI|nr:uncharacterized protein B0T26DRAFT_745285 [Lasiosphaeria miniovina]KAK0733218.1 hypothetical protein B0T26DRAFT_745285 [Lasiosphaeria miniovina]
MASGELSRTSNVIDGIRKINDSAWQKNEREKMTGIADTIWGRLGDAEGKRKRDESLEGYLSYCEREVEFARRGTLTAREDLMEAIECLKSRPSEARANLKEGRSEPLPLPLAVRLMYGTACLSLGTVGGDIFRPIWKESKTLAKYIERVYPRSTDAVLDSRSVRVHKLSMSYLASFATVDLRWTNQLTDHLILLKGDGWKSLYLFRHPAFLRHSLQTLGNNNPDLEQSTAEALSLGCLPPGLLRETLMTYDLLFPRAGDSQSRSILEREVARHQLDPSFLEPSRLQAEHHNNYRDALDSADVRSLYEKYPYWGDRLYDLWKEADDPTPVTAVERWSEARRNPRFTYWCTVVSVSIAIAFGMAATALGAIQVWISYCGWVDDPTKPLCRT